MATVTATSTNSSDIEQRLFVLLVRTASAKTFEVHALLRRHGLTDAQYNVLRILRGAGKSGLRCGQITERMLTRLPDITRLVDRLERDGYVTRARRDEDRRVIVIRLTPRGRQVLAKLDEPVRSLHVRQFSSLTSAQKRTLEQLLSKALNDD